MVILLLPESSMIHSTDDQRSRLKSPIPEVVGIYDLMNS
ncbi:MAG: hypothetical protein K0S95_483 [Pantoea eucrina]|jgi:hypothetical protein|nr:hypothetical protein [Pantoea eucrina]